MFTGENKKIFCFGIGKMVLNIFVASICIVMIQNAGGYTSNNIAIKYKSCKVIPDDLFLSGDIFIIGLFYKTSYDNLPWIYSITNSIQTYNNNEGKNESAIKLGYILHDTCSGNGTSMKSSLLKLFSVYRNITLEKTAVVISFIPQSNLHHDNFLPSDLPIFSYYGNNVYITNTRKQYDTNIPIYTFDYYQAVLYRDAVLRYSWNNIVIISVSRRHDAFVKTQLWNLLVENELCVSYTSVNTTDQNQSLVEFILNIKRDLSKRVFIVWGDKNDTFTFFKTVEKYNITDKIWMGNLAWTHSPFTQSLQISQGMLRLQMPPTIGKGFYYEVCNYSSIDKNNWIKNYKNHSKLLCSSQNISIDSRIADYTMENIMKSIKHVVLSLTNQKALNISEIRKSTLKRYKFPLHDTNLTMVSYSNNTTNIKNVMESLPNRTWYDNLPWVSHNNSSGPFKTFCIKKCKLGLKKTLDERTGIKGWKRVSGYVCQLCTSVIGPSCNMYTDKVMAYYSLRAYIIYALMAVGALTALTVSIIFYVHRNTPFVKASHQSMSLVQLFAHLVLFIAPFMFIGKPTQQLCTSRPIVIGILYTFIMAMTLTKTQKLVFIFQSRLRVSKKQVHMSKTMEFSLIVIMLIVQSCIATLSFLMDPSRIMIKYESDTLHRIIKCNTEEEFFIQLLFGFLLALMCMMQAFKARNLPENFNETKRIFLTMVLCVLSVLVLIPLRFYSSEYDVKLSIDVLLLLVMNFILLVTMYGYKCYIILFKPERNTTSAFKENIQAHVIKGVLQNRFITVNRFSGNSEQLQLSDRNTDRNTTVRVNIGAIN